MKPITTKQSISSVVNHDIQAAKAVNSLLNSAFYASFVRQVYGQS